MLFIDLKDKSWVEGHDKRYSDSQQGLNTICTLETLLDLFNAALAVLQFVGQRWMFDEQRTWMDMVKVVKCIYPENVTLVDVVEVGCVIS